MRVQYVNITPRIVNIIGNPMEIIEQLNDKEYDTHVVRINSGVQIMFNNPEEAERFIAEL